MNETWWQSNLPSRLNDFKKWVGGVDAPSRIQLRDHIKKMGYKSVLDVGCGTAEDIEPLVRDGVEYTGLDNVRCFLDNLKRWGVGCINSTVENIPIQDNSMDLVFCRHVLEHTNAWEQVLSEMIRVSRHEAAVVFFLIPGNESKMSGDARLSGVILNHYSRNQIESFVSAISSVDRFEWENVSPRGYPSEVILHIYKKPLLLDVSIGVCVCTYDCPRQKEFLTDLFDSLQSQTYKNWKVYLYHDGSIKIKDFLESWKERIPLEYISQKKSGVIGTVKSRVVEYAASRFPDFIQMVDHDDVLLPTMLEKMATRLYHSGASWVNCHGDKFEEDAGTIQSTRMDEQTIMKINGLTSWAMFRTTDLLAHNFRKGLKHLEDWDLWIRMIRSGMRYEIVNEYLYRYRMHGTQFHKITNEKKLFHAKKMLVLNGIQINEEEFKIAHGL